MGKITVYESISQFNKLFGIETLHPLISICDASRVNPVEIEGSHCYNFYSIFLKDVNCGDLRYGRNYYDYQEGTLVFMAPMQVMSVENQKTEKPQGWVLMFHPDLLRGTSLGQNMKKYTFFSYEVNEALHLSEQEREIVINCFHNIENELRHAMDNNSKDLIVSNLELFLNYSKRFYERQFVTRSHMANDALSRFERILDDYFHSDLPRRKGIPTAKYCADKMNLSVNYLSDMLRKDTGKSTLEHIQLRLVEVAKETLLGTQKSVSEVAYELGFEYPQYFSRLFKKRVGMTPNEYRAAN